MATRYSVPVLITGNSSSATISVNNFTISSTNQPTLTLSDADDPLNPKQSSIGQYDGIVLFINPPFNGQIQIGIEDNTNAVSLFGNFIQLGANSAQTLIIEAGYGATSPTPTSAGSVTGRYGGAGTFLGDPAGWISFQHYNGVIPTTRKIPYY